jgi:hypothetical protein
MKGVAGERLSSAPAAAAPRATELITQVITYRALITNVIGVCRAAAPRHQEVTADGAA